MSIQNSTRLALLVAMVATIAAGMSNRMSFAVEFIVVPLGFEATEGERIFANDLPPTPDGGRVQELYLPTDFAVLGSGPFELSGLALRPDNSIRTPYEFTWDIKELNLSTTDHTSLTSQFAKNRGSDVTKVYSGELQFLTDGSGPVSGPRNFDYVIDFDQPFAYDPGQGNLLVEWVFGPDVGNSKHDGADTATSRILVNFNDSAAASGTTLEAASVIQFTVPEPSGSLLGLLGITLFQIARPRWRCAMDRNPTTDLF